MTFGRASCRKRISAWCAGISERFPEVLRASSRATVGVLLLLVCEGMVLSRAGLRADAAPDTTASGIKTVYIVPTSHYDFGFIEPPDQVRERAARHLDEVLDMAESDPEFRWTIESVWQVNEWLKRARKPESILPRDEAKIEKLMGFIRSGKIALSAAWGSMHTDFMDVEELNRLCYDFVSLKRRFRIDSGLAVLNDVPGHPAGLPSVLDSSGIKYLVTGANLFLVGGTSLAPGKVPFYWEGPDGSRVLTWVSQGRHGGYTEALADFFLDPYSHDPYGTKTPFEILNPGKPKPNDLQLMEQGVSNLQKYYGEAGYAYDAVMVLWAHDFIEPRNVKNLERAVELWNTAHQTPVLKIATPPEFFQHIENKYAGRIPTYRGEWSGLWSDAKTHSPQISALARRAHNRTLAAESLWSAITLRYGIPFPVGNIATLFDLMFTYDEHSGAGNSGWPQLNTRANLEEQNRQYVRDMKRSRSETDYLLESGMALLARQEVPEPVETLPKSTFPLLVYNPVSWKRTDVVTLPPPQSGLRIIAVRNAEDGRPVLFDVADKGEISFVAESVPSLGYKTFLVETEKGEATATFDAADEQMTLQGRHFHVRLNPEGSVQSLVKLATGRELVSRQAGVRFNQLLRVQGSEPAGTLFPVEPEVRIQKGRTFQRIEVRRPRSLFPLTTITLYDSIPRIDISNEIDSSQLPFASIGSGSNSYFFAYPFALDAATLKVMAEGHRGFIQLPQDYLPGARRDSVTSQHVVCLADSAGAVMLAHRQSFHFVFAGYLKTKASAASAKDELPAMLTGSWPLPEATLFAKAFRQSNQSDTHDLRMTNLRTVEPGLADRYRFDYSIDALPAFDATAASRLGRELNLPLRPQYVAALPREPAQSFFSVDRENVVILAVKPEAMAEGSAEISSPPAVSAGGRRFIVRLQEVAGVPETALQLKTPVPVKTAGIVNLTEEKVIQSAIPVNPVKLKLKPYQVATVRLEFGEPE
ncbi:MAG: glycosyl hydrolase-related protein [Acidobacteriota bacterium]